VVVFRNLRRVGLVASLMYLVTYLCAGYGRVLPLSFKILDRDRARDHLKMAIRPFSVRKLRDRYN
jgi:hypothetical protein